MNQTDLEAILLRAFPDAKISLKDMTGGGDHWQLSIASAKFAGLTMVKQHQLVYQALGDLMKKEIHALALTTTVLGP